MPLIHCKLNEIQSMQQFYEALYAQLGLPKLTGRNLDALWDILSTDIEGPIEIHWPTAYQDRHALGEQAAALFELLDDVADERDDMTIILG
ncbi:ribonuclease inhibitor [Chitinivorax tropicus]|uniref:Ribonuclease inhibitor n=1 Tax=Chitinivorax tropicus TaxID=714531 RepID=A0A840MRR1_9PROT|nr:barstar family protein [Chitinivorax tropicus]MBB5019769.1 ribonuclease inhibitor [Chitinivorax tropicus]